MKDPVFEKLWSDPWTTLAVSLAFKLDGQDKEAGTWYDRGCKNLESLPKDLRRTAQFLRATDPPLVESFTHISMGSDDRALVFALLGRRLPAKKAEYDSAATGFNISRKFPYQLVQRARENETGCCVNSSSAVKRPERKHAKVASGLYRSASEMFKQFAR